LFQQIRCPDLMDKHAKDEEISLCHVIFYGACTHKRMADVGLAEYAGVSGAILRKEVSHDAI
jgi:hypothetical protein